MGQPWFTRIAPVAEGLAELLAEHGLVDGHNKFTATEIAQRCALTPSEVGKVLANPNAELGRRVGALIGRAVTVERVRGEGRTWAAVQSATA